MSKKTKHRADKRKEQRDNREDELIGFEDEADPVEPRVTEKMILVPLLDQAEVNRLLNASDAPYKGPQRPSSTHLNYPTYNQYECLALLNDKPIDKRPSKKK